jgi:hypothetical protein
VKSEKVEETPAPLEEEEPEGEDVIEVLLLRLLLLRYRSIPAF